MKQIILTISLLCCSLWALSQNPVNPVCDETLEIPYSFSYSGFILLDNGGAIANPGAEYNMRVDISQDDANGMVVYSEEFSSPFSRQGFFQVDIGKENVSEFSLFLNHLNDNGDKDYFINVYYNNPNSGQYVLIGTKSIQTVPYAMVANSLNGLGNIGIDGPVGPAGPTGPVGPTGQTPPTGLIGPAGAQGANGFGVMVMSSAPPSNNNTKFYVDDGTNTADGEPHLRYRINSNTWIDL